jgi:TRAP-type C4-dicarboxylate transport system substrate-binding protein
MKIRILYPLSIAFFVVSCFLPGIACAKINLTYNTYFPPTHVMAKLSKAWCEEVEKRTDGKVKIQFYAGGQLLQAPKVIDGVTQGIADIGFSNLAYTRGRFPEMEMCDLPLGYSSGWVASHLANRFYQEFKPEEFDVVQPLYFSGCGPNLIGTVTKPVKELGDLKGVTLRGTGRVADLVEGLGAVARPIPVSEWYEALKRNVIDGVMLPIETYKGFRLGEVLGYCTVNWQVANSYVFYAVMNKKKYNSLPEDVKKVISDVNAEWIEKTAQGWNEIDFVGAEYFKSQGGEFIYLSDEEAKNWIAKIQPIIDQYIADMVKLGHSESELRNREKWIKENIADLIKEQKSLGIKVPYSK